VEPRVDRGSFRDPDSRVFYAGGSVHRALSERGLADWEALAASTLFRDKVAEGKLVGTEQLAKPNGLPAELDAERVAAVLRHDRVPVVSYPYEWPFGMLKDAALLELELLLAALDEDLMLKDASPYNVQWRGTQPVFVDVGSFERLREGEPWAGYRQFCTLVLYPLMLQAFRKVPFQPWLRGSLEGIEPAEMRRLLTFRDRFRRGVLTNVVLHAKLEARYADREVKQDLKRAGFRTELIRVNARKLRRLVQRLEWQPGRTAWSTYRTTNPYDEPDAAAKLDFVRETAGARHRRLVWDLGCNDGRFTRVAAMNADYTVAVDADAAVVEALYRELSADGVDTILPLVGNLADPSPGLGWRGEERRPLVDRGRPDLTLALALVHHVALTSNVPIRDFLDWLAGLQTELVIEFPTRDDPMVQRLLSRKGAGANPDYDTETFERALNERWRVERRETLPSGTRILYRAIPSA
jgi:SAM-dependent methyltransferase